MVSKHSNTGADDTSSSTKNNFSADMISRLTATYVLLCIGLFSWRNGVASWSTEDNHARRQPVGSNRRGFLVQAASKAGVAIVGTAANIGVVNEIHGGVKSAHAVTTTTKIYQPPPDSLAGQLHLITGASTGLGLESAKRLAGAGATVVMTARTDTKGQNAKQQVLEYLQERSIDNKEIYVLVLDLNDFSSIKSFPERYEKMLGSRKIDVLMNNAGAINKELEITKDGFERTFQTNHLGPFLLTSLLFPYLNREGARIINVSSIAHESMRPTIHETGKLGLDMKNLNGEISYAIDGWEAYGQTKLENILFTQELQRRADAAGLTWLTTVALHPGVVGTDIWRSTPVAKGQSQSKFSMQALASSLFYNSVLTTEEGANTQVMLASQKNIAKGRYYDENGRLKELAAFAKDASKAKELWEASEKLTGCAFSLT